MENLVRPTSWGGYSNDPRQIRLTASSFLPDLIGTDFIQHHHYQAIVKVENLIKLQAWGGNTAPTWVWFPHHQTISYHQTVRPYQGYGKSHSIDGPDRWSKKTLTDSFLISSLILGLETSSSSSNFQWHHHCNPNILRIIIVILNMMSFLKCSGAHHLSDLAVSHFQDITTFILIITFFFFAYFLREKVHSDADLRTDKYSVKFFFRSKRISWNTRFWKKAIWS